ncbi:probable GTP pyrophosphokinase isoform X2 [Eupeodes corollae]|uniref:probable GTP pyrophosphokinase isoform X2 n=1 Tax=Eupeodes corollae TaxID=290404 RepID=UPI00249348AC|nr:probable GTP pyrophosphokinase isoform X2 [Eupeodes corollae]
MAKSSYTTEDHIQMLKLYYKNNCSLTQTLRALRPLYSKHGGPSKSTVQRLVNKFQKTGSVNNQPAVVRQRNARSLENIAAVLESVQENPNQSIPNRAKELGLSQTSTWRILNRDLGLNISKTKNPFISIVNMDMDPLAELMQCVQFAAYKHRDQRREDPNKTPFINHPINVATILAVEAGIEDKEILQAALLHDVIEDTETTLEEIEVAFGKNVADIVKEITVDKSLPEPERKELQVELSKKLTKNAKLVKLADTVDKLRDLQNVLPDGWNQVSYNTKRG